MSLSLFDLDTLLPSAHMLLAGQGGESIDESLMPSLFSTSQLSDKSAI